MSGSAIAEAASGATGGPYFARALFNADFIDYSGALTRWASSARLHRLSCSRCGTPIFAEPQDGPWLAVAIATLDNPDRAEARVAYLGERETVLGGNRRGTCRSSARAIRQPAAPTAAGGDLLASAGQRLNYRVLV